MKKIVLATFFIFMLSSAYSYAEEQYDLKCTLDSGDVMALSHISSTVYIEFLGPNDDPDEGGSVIKLDIASGGAQQFLNKSSGGTQSFVLRGTDEDIEGAVAVGYENHEGKLDAYFISMNSLGKETERHTCKPETIQAAKEILIKGIGIKAPSQKSQSSDTIRETTETPTASPFKISIGQQMHEYGSIRTPYRTVSITSTSDDLIINSVIVNRNQCSEMYGTPKNPFKLPFGQTFTYNFNIQHKRCEVVEVVVKTNKKDWTFRP